VCVCVCECVCACVCVCVCAKERTIEIMLVAAKWATGFTGRAYCTICQTISLIKLKGTVNW